MHSTTLQILSWFRSDSLKPLSYRHIVPFSHNVLSSYISVHGAYLPFFFPLIWPSYFLLQFILIASMCHSTESTAENFNLAGIFFRTFIIVLSKIDSALIPSINTFPYIEAFSSSVPPFLFSCLPLSSNIYSVCIMYQKLFKCSGYLSEPNR